jgi:hypothetical protein
MTRLALTVLLLLVLAHRADAHAFHVTVAEAEVNHKTGRIEFALRVHPGDLELALGRIAKRRIRLEKEPQVDSLIRNYLQRSIELKSGKSKPREILWIGKDVSIKWAWLYFEIPLKKGLDKTTLTNTMFIEILKDQENTIVLRDGKRRQTLSFRKDKAIHKIHLTAPPTAAVYLE